MRANRGRIVGDNFVRRREKSHLLLPLQKQIMKARRQATHAEQQPPRGLRALTYVVT